MAIDYTGANNGIFRHIGKLIKKSDAFKTSAASLNTDLQEILDAWQLGSQDLASEGLASTYEGYRSRYADMRSSLVGYATRRLQEDRAGVLMELRLEEGADIQTILFWLIRQMIVDSQTVDASVVTLGARTYPGTNKGNGLILIDKVLDGRSSPGRGAAGAFPPNPEYAGVNSELCYNESMRAVCVTDSYQDRATAGEEQFDIYGGPADAYMGARATADVGSGDRITITCLNANTILANTNFENFTSNVPDSWTLDNGTAGTHVYEESGASNVYRGSKSLRFKGDGAQANIQISQTPSAGLLVATQRYLLSCFIKADAAIAAGTLTIQFEGTGYTAASSEKISIAPGALPTSWTHQNFYLNIPRNVPTDMELVIKWTGTPTDNKNVYIDSLAFGPVDWIGGFSVAAIAGSTPWAKNDTATWSVTNDEAGIIQRFFRDAYGVQLPSNDAGAETILDTLAT